MANTEPLTQTEKEHSAFELGKRGGKAGMAPKDNPFDSLNLKAKWEEGRRSTVKLGQDKRTKWARPLTNPDKKASKISEAQDPITPPKKKPGLTPADIAKHWIKHAKVVHNAAKKMKHPGYEIQTLHDLEFAKHKANIMGLIQKGKAKAKAMATPAAAKDKTALGKNTKVDEATISKNVTEYKGYEIVDLPGGFSIRKHGQTVERASNIAGAKKVIDGLPKNLMGKDVKVEPVGTDKHGGQMYKTNIWDMFAKLDKTSSVKPEGTEMKSSIDKLLENKGALFCDEVKKRLFEKATDQADARKQNLFTEAQIGVARFMGTTDGAPPESNTEAELSTVHEIYQKIQQIHGDSIARRYFASLPDNVKLEYNYSKWRYTPTGKIHEGVIAELSARVLGSYIPKAKASADQHFDDHHKATDKNAMIAALKKSRARKAGVEKAKKKVSFVESEDKIQSYFDRVDKHLPTLPHDEARRQFLHSQRKKFEDAAAEMQRKKGGGGSTGSALDYSSTIAGLHSRIGKLK